MIYLVEGYDLPFFWEGLLSPERSHFVKSSLGMVEGYDLPPQNMVEGYDLPNSKNSGKLSFFCQAMVEGFDLPPLGWWKDMIHFF